MNAKIVESQSLRRGFRQSFHILDYFFIPVKKEIHYFVIR